MRTSAGIVDGGSMSAVWYAKRLPSPPAAPSPGGPVSLADRAEATGAPAFVPDPRLTNEDLAPAEKRNWKVFDLFAMWMSDVHNLGNYTFAAGLLVLGMYVWQVLTSLPDVLVYIY